MQPVLSQSPPRRGSTCSSQVEMHVEDVIRLRTGGMIRELRVDVGSDRVTLSGCTSSFYNKQLATHAAMEAIGTQALNNDIVVR